MSTEQVHVLRKRVSDGSCTPLILLVQISLLVNRLFYKYGCTNVYLIKVEEAIPIRLK